MPGPRPTEESDPPNPLFDVLMLRGVFLGVGWLVHWHLQTIDRPDASLKFWGQWDAATLLRIADLGYADSIADGNAAAFFPGYPLAVRAVHSFGVELVTAGLLVTTVATIVAAHYLGRLALADGHDPARTVMAMLLFPTAVFLVAPYSEALFLAGTVAAFFHARCGRPWLGALCAAIATGTRVVGVFVALGVAVEVFRRSARRPVDALRSAGVAAIGVVPVALFALHLRRTRGDALEFVRAQERGWGRSLTDPIHAFVNSWRSFGADVGADFLIAYRLEIAFALASILLVGWLVRHREWGYVTYVGGTLALALSNVVFVSIPRIALTFFPFAFVVADATATPTRHVRIMVVMAATSMVGVVAFVNGRWFF